MAQQVGSVELVDLRNEALALGSACLTSTIAFHPRLKVTLCAGAGGVAPGNAEAACRTADTASRRPRAARPRR